MKNRFIKRTAVILLLLTMLLLSACEKKRPTVSESVSVSDTTEVSVSLPEPEPEPETLQAADFELADYFTKEEVMQKYTDYLATVLSEEDAGTARYTLAYVNSDSIPELIYMEGNFRSAGAHVCICDADGKVSDIGEFGEYGNMAYVEKTGKIISFYMNQGVYFTDFYVLNGLSLIADTYFEIDEAVLDSESDHYYVDGDEVSADEYRKRLNAMDQNAYSAINFDKALSYKDTDDVFRVLNEFALTDVCPSMISLTESCPQFIGDWTVMGMTASKGASYTDAVDLDLTGILTVSDSGHASFKLTYGEKEVVDDGMPVTYKGNDGEAPYFTSLGFSNDDLTRDYVIYLTGEGRLEVCLTDFSGFLEDGYVCYFYLVKTVV